MEERIYFTISTKLLKTAGRKDSLLANHPKTLCDIFNLFHFQGYQKSEQNENHMLSVLRKLLVQASSDKLGGRNQFSLFKHMVSESGLWYPQVLWRKIYRHIYKTHRLSILSAVLVYNYWEMINMCKLRESRIGNIRAHVR